MLEHYVKKILTSRVYDVAVETPLQPARQLSERIGNQILLKREDLQPVFSFKVRGAYNKLAQLSPEELARGVVTASAGNHAQGVALAAKQLGIKATIVMPRTTPELKVQGVRARGGKVVLHGDAFPEALAYSLKLVEEKGYVYIHPYDDPDVIAGQGTVAMEILRQHQGPIDAIFVPVGGGGLVAGIAAYVKYLYPQTRVIGVEPDDSNCLQAAMAAGERVVLEQVGLFADGVAVAQIGQHTFDVCKHYVDEVITVSTDEICAAIKDIYDDTRSITEPAGALAVAGIKKYVERDGVSGQVLVGIDSAPTSISTACAMSPSAPNWARSAKRSSPSPFPSSPAASRPFARRSASARSPNSITATTPTARRTFSSACRPIRKTTRALRWCSACVTRASRCSI